MNLKYKKGFTLIELMLSLTFVATLLLAMALTIIQIGANYNRGITIKEVNQSGRSLSEDMRFTISSSPGIGDGVVNYSYDGKLEQGRLCLGGYSYIWNYGQSLTLAEEGTPLYDRLAKIETRNANNLLVSSNVRLVKVADATSKYCLRGETGGFLNNRITESERGVDLLASGDRKLSVYKFEVEAPTLLADTMSSKAIYKASISIGAGDAAFVHRSLDRCNMPGEGESDLVYCTIQNFKITVVGGGV